MQDLTQPQVRLLYIAHDLTDPAIRRRVRMLKAGGAEVLLAGFRRAPLPVGVVEGVKAYDLGRTQNSKLILRIGTIVRAAARLPALAKSAGRIDVILARNLETLVLARLLVKRSQRLAYEVLDIHRLLLGQNLGSIILRGLERWAAQPLDLLIVSSPAFLQAYFATHWTRIPPARLVENKPLLQPEHPARRGGREGGPPWRIGWFGMLRCQKSLDVLCALARTPGLSVEVILRGRPSLEAFSDFHGQIAATPGVSYLGPYEPEEAPKHYAGIHLAWAIDFYEEGQNSAWLLPNRLYDSLCWGAVPIALQDVQTGRWLAAHSSGIRVEDVGLNLTTRLRALDAKTYTEHLRRIEAIVDSALTCSVSECRNLVADLAGAQA